MNFKHRVSRNIEAMQKEMGKAYWNIAASRIWFRKILPQVLEENSEGKLLDAGAGNLLYKQFLQKHCDTYHSLDVEENPGLDFVQDIQNLDLDTETYDTVFCRNVLEHVESPRKAMSEIYRVTDKGGRVIVSVPHLSYLHNEPEYYYRFTEYGFEEITQKSTDFNIIEFYRLGGLFSFLANLIYLFMIGLTYHLPYLPKLLYYPNYLIQFIGVKLDQITQSTRIMPQNYVFVLEKD